MKASKRVWSIVALGGAIILSAWPQRAAGQNIQAPPQMLPYGVSGDGLTVAGTGYRDGHNEPVLWRSGVAQYLGALENDHTFANALSDDGQVVVGTDYSVVGYRWTEIGGFQGIGQTGIPFDLTPDGAIIVGQSTAGATRWTQATGVTLLGDLVGGGTTASAHAITPSGAVIVGLGYLPGAGLPTAFRWTQVSGPLALVDLAGGDESSDARAVTPDGATIVGYGTAADGQQPMRWTAALGMQGLGHLAGFVDSSTADSSAIAIASDGSFILGHDSVGANQTRAFFWDEAGGMQPLDDVLSSRYGIDTTGWQLETITGLSADGNTIIGIGRFGSSIDLVGFRITLVPEPSSICLAAIGGLAIVAFRSAKGRVRRQAS